MIMNELHFFSSKVKENELRLQNFQGKLYSLTHEIIHTVTGVLNIQERTAHKLTQRHKNQVLEINFHTFRTNWTRKKKG